MCARLSPRAKNTQDLRGGYWSEGERVNLEWIRLSREKSSRVDGSDFDPVSKIAATEHLADGENDDNKGTVRRWKKRIVVMNHVWFALACKVLFV